MGNAAGFGTKTINYPSTSGGGYTENRFLTPRPSVAVTGRRALDEECACNERAVCKQRGSRKMRVLDLAGRSERTHLTALAHFAFEYYRAAPVDDDHLERWAALAGFAWPDETHHFVSHSARDVPVTHRLYRLLPLVLDPCAEPAASVFHFQSPSGLGFDSEKARSSIQAT